MAGVLLGPTDLAHILVLLALDHANQKLISDITSDSLLANAGAYHVVYCILLKLAVKFQKIKTLKMQL